MPIIKSIFALLLLCFGFTHASELVEPALPTLATMECRSWSNQDEPIPKSISTYLIKSVLEDMRSGPESVNSSFEIVDKQCASLLLQRTPKK